MDQSKVMETLSASLQKKQCFLVTMAFALGVLFVATAVLWFIVASATPCKISHLPFIVVASMLFILLIVVLASYTANQNKYSDAEISEMKAESKANRDKAWDQYVQSTGKPYKDQLAALEGRINSVESSSKVTTPKSEILSQAQSKIIALYVASRNNSALTAEDVVKILDGSDKGYKEIENMINQLK